MGKSVPRLCVPGPIISLLSQNTLTFFLYFNFYGMNFHHTWLQEIDSLPTSSLANLFLLQLPWASVLLFYFILFFAPTPTWPVSACKATCWGFAKAEVYPGSLSVRRTQPMPRVLTLTAPQEPGPWEASMWPVSVERRGDGSKPPQPQTCRAWELLWVVPHLVPHENKTTHRASGTCLHPLF